MENNQTNIPSFDEIVFEFRNKEYGAYKIRKKYNRTVLWAMLVGTLVLGSIVITPYVMATVSERRQQKEEKAVTAEMEQLDQPNQEIAPPPPPPPAEAQVQVKYVAPVIVDSVKADDKQALATIDDVKETTTDEAVVEAVEEVKEEVQEVKEEEVFLVVEEMPGFNGGDANTEFRKYVAANMKYPDIAAENGIQGKVFVQFVIEADGRISNVRVIRGVDPSLDKEAIRVIESSPKWNPGKQRGKPVRVSYTFPITFMLTQ